MTHDRRSFIKRFGATLGSLIVSGSLSGCGPRKNTGMSDTKDEPTKQNVSWPKVRVPSAPEWRQLGECWLSLKTLNEDVSEAIRKNGGLGSSTWRDTKAEERIATHQALLNALVTTGQLDESVAQYMQTAFEEAVYHVDRFMSTCYSGIGIGYAPREDLLQQARVLGKMDFVDHLTLRKARAAIAQDMVFFELIKSDPVNYMSFANSYMAGDLTTNPEALQAAWLLTQLFLEALD
jgi:hypothetical protein